MILPVPGPSLGQITLSKFSKVKVGSSGKDSSFWFFGLCSGRGMACERASELSGDDEEIARLFELSTGVLGRCGSTEILCEGGIMHCKDGEDFKMT